MVDDDRYRHMTATQFPASLKKDAPIEGGRHCGNYIAELRQPTGISTLEARRPYEGLADIAVAGH